MLKRCRVFPALIALIPACDDGPPIRPLEGATPVTRGALTLTRIEFATTDFYVRPTKTRAEEGRLRVPESRRQRNGRTLELRFVRFRAERPGAGAPIVYLAGGPGASGIYSASGDRHELFMRLRPVADVIALDQRGAGLSAPSPWCPGSWSYPLDLPHNDSTMAAVLAPYLRACDRHWAAYVDVTAFNTV